MNDTKTTETQIQQDDAGTSASSALSDLERRVEQVAEQYVLIECNDPAGLTVLSQGLRELGEVFATNAAIDPGRREKCAAALNAVTLLVVSIARGDCRNPESTFAIVGRTLLALQKAGRDVPLDKMGFPAELEIDFSNGNAREASGNAAQTTPPSPTPIESDQEILKLFLEQEEARLQDFEEGILALEKDPQGGALTELRGTLHTMKGEAGVVGAEEITSVCHKLEDYLDASGPARSTELLMEVRDWLDRAIHAHCDGQKPAGTEALIAKLGHAIGEVGTIPEQTSHRTNPIVEKPAATDAPALMTAIEIGDKDLAKEFVAEAQEYFESADENLLILENDPANAEAIGAVFRAFHTIKGVAGFLGLKPICDLSHQAETLLDMVRNGKKPFAGNVVEVTFRALDMLKTLVADVNQAVLSSTAFVPRPELVGIIARLQDVISGHEPLVETSARTDAATPAVKPQTAEPSEDGAAESPEEKPTSDVGAAIKQAVKIDADRLDLLIDTIGELVIAESMVTQDREIKSLRSLRVEKNLAHLGKITRMLQDMSMSMRMVPIEATFRKMTRLVRDLAKKAGKRVELTLVGKETELDRAMVDKLNDPLVHMIRNSVDHGLEPEAERVAADKSPAGHVTLKAYHRGGSIHIEVTDDGRGLDRDAILAKGIERGLIQPDQNLSDKEIYALIFEPGFSTAKQITEISGRGVGMDVVRRTLDSLRGNILIETVRGKGSTFTLVLPLTTAIIDGITVRVGTDTYIIPTLSIVESFKPTADMLSTVTGKGEMIRFRNSLLPLFRLSRLFAIADGVQDASRATVVVVEDNDKQTALVVDELLGQQQTVIKSLGEAIGTVTGVSGASILADGRPGLILDVGGIVKLAVSESKR